jgi:hypothetical protein
MINCVCVETKDCDMMAQTSKCAPVRDGEVAGKGNLNCKVINGFEIPITTNQLLTVIEILTQ